MSPTQFAPLPEGTSGEHRGARSELEDTVIRHPLLSFDANKEEWLSSNAPASDSVTQVPFKDIQVISWNVQFETEFPAERMGGACNTLKTLFNPPSSALTSVILLQEVNRDALDWMLSDVWVQSHFSITNAKLGEYESYGTVSLVGRHLSPGVASAFRVKFRNSVMGRDVLFVELQMETHGLLRIGNTHLESLPMGTKIRPLQLQIIRKYLQEDEVIAGVVGGDMNAIRDEDTDLPQRLGFTDLWFDAYGEQGDTWGYQPPCEFAPGRLDKLLAMGRVGLGEGGIKIIGQGVAVDVNIEKDEELDLDASTETVFVTDHYGLCATIRLSGKKEIEIHH